MAWVQQAVPHNSALHRRPEHAPCAISLIEQFLQDQYGAIANQGIFGQEGMRTIDKPMTAEEERILAAIQPFIDQQTGLYQDQTRASLDQIRDQGADRRRRATRAAGTALGRTVGQRPGLAAQMMAEAAAPVTAAQAGLEFQAGQRGTEQELQLGAGAFDLSTGIYQGRGQRRSGLEQENIASKAQIGLPGVAGASQYQADLLGSRYWDLSNPMQNQFSFQSGLMGLGQGFDMQKMAIQQRYGQMNMQQQFDLKQKMEKWMADNNYGQSEDSEWWEVLFGGAKAGADIYGKATGG